jgi:flavin reductase (DIM6/NTAB) family NADH-FMN oxidoreductase RutF
MAVTSLSPIATTTGSELFKSAFRAHPAGVAIVTATGEAGPVGLTASSVSSVSARPPILAFSVSGSRSASLLVEADTVLVHLVNAGQIELARTFATPGSSRFTDAMDWEPLASGEPLLRAAPWVLRCELIHRAPMGGSVLVAANVLEIRAQAQSQGPLVYHDRSFHRLGWHSQIS